GPISPSSALRRTPLLLIPAATSTLPSGSNVAVCAKRAVLRLPVALHVPLAGSYSSALLTGPLLLCPPATSTLPSGSNVAVGAERAVVRLPVLLHVTGASAGEWPRDDAAPAIIRSLSTAATCLMTALRSEERGVGRVPTIRR